MATALFVLAFFLSDLPAGTVFGMVKPIYVIVIITFVCNAFLYVDGEFQFTEAGFMHGCYYGLRILLLVWMSLIVCLTSTSTQLTDALSSFLRPLRKLHVPTDDIAMVFSIALRFIPLTAEEFMRVKDAQWSRGAKFGKGGLVARIGAYFAVLIPMFVGLFRRADSLAQALDMRCYGMPGIERTSITATHLKAPTIFVTLFLSAIFICMAVLL